MSTTLAQIKSELQAATADLNGSIAAIRAEVSELKGTVQAMEGSLSVCTDGMVSLQTKVERLSGQVVSLENKCEDLEARSRRNNIRILGLPEEHGQITATTISTLLKEALDLKKPPLIDCAHRSPLAKPKPGERPRPVIALLRGLRGCFITRQK